jgi:alpha-amylase
LEKTYCMKIARFGLMLLIGYSFSILSCKTSTQPIPGANKVVAGIPEWILQGNIYEVNVRQYTAEGTLNAFAKHLDRLKEMGVQTLWFMPINPISTLERKGSLGSYYAVSDYNAVNPEFGTMDDFKAMVKAIHDRDMKVIIDWVPNHTGADHRWITEQPDFFVKDSTGKPAVAFDWADVRQLDYKNTVMQDSMIQSMKWWIQETGIDGFRVDVAWNIPASFWKKCLPQIKAMGEKFMLAEGDSAYLAKSGFDAVYPWHMFKMMEKIAKGERPAFGLDSVKAESDTLYLPGTIQMYFTSNHDENSWNKADHGTFPGAVHAPFAVFTQTMANSVPLVYSGQEEPLARALKFFDKDSIAFSKYERSKFYATLHKLRQANDALSADAGFRKIAAGDSTAVYAFVREKGTRKVLVVLNLSGKEQTITIKDTVLAGKPFNIFGGSDEEVLNKVWQLEPWGYAVYDYK